MRGGETVDLGSVMYAAISFINHSCYANCDWYYCGDIEVIKALRRIRAGEPLSINYQSWCGLYSETNLEQRRKHHQRDYFFNCDCVACSGMWGEPAGKKASSCPNAAPWVLEVCNHIKRVIDKERAFDPKMMTSLVEIVEGYDKILTDSHGLNSRPFLEMEEFEDSFLETASVTSTSLLTMPNLPTHLDSLQTEVKLRTGEVQQLQSDVSQLRRLRDGMNREVTELTRENEQLQAQLEELVLLRDSFRSLEENYNALLQMFGEKVEENEELKMDLQDIKEAYKLQIDQLTSTAQSSS
ncbi:unnamed protein product [Cyprideis torosa]|uniref:Uncharacterized protein n=1 Tax=Cyprideis torosa TaxID=163714 RepID=A0A7R8ZKQ7_9CRUS|nr:unnamed protein product [Cyprideis torosa]CAG0889933.1 unnamed protein product [Cyprideis torosa]